MGGYKNSLCIGLAIFIGNTCKEYSLCPISLASNRLSKIEGVEPESEKPSTRQFSSMMLVVQAKPSWSVKASQTTPSRIKRNFISRATRPELLFRRSRYAQHLRLAGQFVLVGFRQSSLVFVPHVAITSEDSFGQWTVLGDLIGLIFCLMLVLENKFSVASKATLFSKAGQSSLRNM